MSPKPLEPDARRSVRWISLPRATASREITLVAGLSQHVDSSALLIAGLTGDSATLGRFQRAGRSGRALEFRRSSGGRSTRSGDGVVSLSALLPSSRAWLDETVALSGPRLLNRLVRGLLAGLAKLGVAASYPGRDFVVVNGRRVAYVALGRETNGILAFQAIVAVDAPYTTKEREPSWPDLPAPPEASCLARERGSSPDFASLAAALAAGFAERFALELDATALSSDEERALERAASFSVADGTRAGLASAGPVAVPIGELEAHVALDGSGRLTRVCFGGDWMASLPELHALEDALVGERPDGPLVRELCAAWLARPESLVVGLTDATMIADAIARSARTYSSPSGSSL